MIIRFPPGMTADRSSDFSLQGLMSNVNAYAEEWSSIVTAGTNVLLTPAQVKTKNIRLTAGASGSFTITLPPTSKIIDVLGPTIPLDGSYWFPFYISNIGVGQTGTLTAGDGDTTIDSVNAAVADSDANKWMVNVVAPVAPGTKMTLNFHSVFSVCCGGGTAWDAPVLSATFSDPG